MATAQNVDFSNVKDGGNFNRKRIPAGDYLATVTKIDDAEAKDGVFQYLVSIKINKISTSVLPYYCKLQDNQLWKLRNLLIAAGLTVPKRRVKIDPNRVVGKLVGVTIEDDDYDGKEQSSIAAIFPAAELGDTADDAAEPEDDNEDEDGLDDDLDSTPDEEPEEEEAEEEEAAEAADPYADFNRLQLKAELKKKDAGFVARKSQTDDDLRALLNEFLANNDDDEEEEAPAPAVKKAAPRAKAAVAAKKPINEVSDDELEELDIDKL